MVLAATLVLLWIGVTLVTLPNVAVYVDRWPDTTAFMRSYLRDADDGRLRYHPVPLTQMPETLRRAVLVSEDAAFYGHSGFDWHEVRTAIDEALSGERELRGASTITQQLARNLYLTGSRTPTRKLREALITRRLERTLSKNRILALYLNVLEMGPGVYGMDAASLHYFGVPVASVTDRQAAELAATIPSPRRHNPQTDTRQWRWRSELIAQRAFGAGGDSIVDAQTLLDALAMPDSLGVLDSLGEGPSDRQDAAPDTSAVPGDATQDTLPGAPPDTTAHPEARPR